MTMTMIDYDYDYDMTYDYECLKCWLYCWDQDFRMIIDYGYGLLGFEDFRSLSQSKSKSESSKSKS